MRLCVLRESSRVVQRLMSSVETFVSAARKTHAAKKEKGPEAAAKVSKAAVAFKDALTAVQAALAELRSSS